MQARAKPPSPNDIATKGDVESIVTRIVTSVVNEAIDNFAIIVGRSFADTQAQINGITVELHEFKGNTERALYSLQTDTTDLKDEIKKVKIRLDKVEDHCDTMIGMWRNHEKRIIVLETQ